MLDEGAAIVDVGGESTRPGSDGVSARRGAARASCRCSRRSPARRSRSTPRRPRSRAGRSRSAPSSSTTSPRCAATPSSPGVVADAGAYLCLMHMRGEPRTMQVEPALRRRRLRGEGVPRGAARVRGRGRGSARSSICLDPGIGFGKTVEHNFELVRRLDELVAIGRPLVIGFSRKSSLGRILGDPEATDGSARRVGRRRGRGLRARRDDPPRARRPRARRGARACAAAVGRMRVELRGLELFGHHGVGEEERERGQRFVYDVELEVGERGADDRIEDAVDYREVAAAVREVAERAVPPARGARRGDRRRAAASASRSSGCGARAQARGPPGRPRRRVQRRHRRARRDPARARVTSGLRRARREPRRPRGVDPRAPPS